MKLCELVNKIVKKELNPKWFTGSRWFGLKWK